MAASASSTRARQRWRRTAGAVCAARGSFPTTLTSPVMGLKGARHIVLFFYRGRCSVPSSAARRHATYRVASADTNCRVFFLSSSVERLPMATRPGPAPDSAAQRDARTACVKMATRCVERWAKANTDVVRALAAVSNTVLQRPCVWRNGEAPWRCGARLVNQHAASLGSACALPLPIAPARTRVAARSRRRTCPASPRSRWSSAGRR